MEEPELIQLSGFDSVVLGSSHSCLRSNLVECPREVCVPLPMGEVRAVSWGWPTRSDRLEGRKAALKVSAASVPLTFVFFYFFQGESLVCLIIVY